MCSVNKSGVDGYMSVEAALVVPAAIFGIVLIIYMAFFVHSRCILSQDVYILGFRSGLFYEKQGYGNAAQYITDHEAEQTKDSYFGSSKPDIKAMQNGNEVKVEGITTTNHDALFGYFKGIPDLWKSEAAAGVKILKPAQTIRKIKRIKDVYKGLTND